MSPVDDVAGRRAWLRRHGPGPITSAVRGGIAPEPDARAVDGMAPKDLPGPGADWVPLGPTEATRGMAGGRPSITGRVRGLAVSADGTRAYAAAANGGVWMTTDGGRRWLALDPWRDTPSADLVASGGGLAIGSVAAIFGATAEDDVVFAGCGEFQEWSGDGVRRFGRPANPADPRAWTVEATNVADHASFRVIVPPPGAPGGATRAWLASNTGLFERPAAGPFDAWTQIPLPSPFDVPAVSDVAMLVDGATEWLFVAVSGEGVLRVQLTAAGSAVGQARLICDGITGGLTTQDRRRLGRISLATAPDGARRVYALLSVRRGSQRARLRRMLNVTAGTPTFRAVTGIPGALWGVGDSDQGTYDQAIAIVPQPIPAPATATDEIIVGGSTVSIEGEWQASLYRGPIAGTATAPTFTPTLVGHGAHADVHHLVFSRGAADKPEAWVGTDGGVYRSHPDVDGGRWQHAHGGMGVLQLTYLAAHPTVPAFLIGGSQDNGMLIHTGEPAWRRHAFAGDAGGVVVDPITPRWMWQYTNGSLFSDVPPATGVPGAVRFPTTTVAARRTQESGNVEFYSPLKLVVVPGAPDLSRVAFGSHRVWTTDDWGTNWLSWPSGTNPAASKGNLRVNQLDGSVIQALDWASPTVLVVATQNGVYRLRGIGAAGAAGDVYARRAGTAARGLKRAGERANQVPPAWATTDATGGTVNDLPAAFSPLAVAALDATGDGVYLGLDPGTTPDDCLWFLPPGAATWVGTGLTGYLGGNTRVHAVIVDQANPRDVYAGTDVGVYRGVRDLPLAPPTWTWEDCSPGLPEAAVRDLDLFAPTGSPVRLLRASTYGRGVWELDIERFTHRNATAPREPEVFVRASATDDGRRIAGVTGLADPTVAPGPPVPRPTGIAESPDIAIVRGRARVVVAPPAAYVGAASGAARQAWRIAASTWGQPLPTVPDEFGAADVAVWQAIQTERQIPVTAVMDDRTWRTTFHGLDTDPGHVAFVDRYGREMAPAPSLWAAADATANRVLVQVRTRGPNAVADARTSVILLWQAVTAAPAPVPAPATPPASHTTVVLPDLPVDWRAKVIAGNIAGLASDGWTVAENRAVPAGALDPEAPSVVGIDVAFGGRAVGSLIALVAIVKCADDLLPADDDAAAATPPSRNLLTVVPAESRIALRVVEVAPA